MTMGKEEKLARNRKIKTMGREDTGDSSFTGMYKTKLHEDEEEEINIQVL